MDEYWLRVSQAVAWLLGIAWLIPAIMVIDPLTAGKEVPRRRLLIFFVFLALMLLAWPYLLTTNAIT